MRYYDVNKTFSLNNSLNEFKIKEYIDSSNAGHRVFRGNFENFNSSKMLMMLGCNISYVPVQNGKYSPCVTHFHAYENDAQNILQLLDSLE